MVHNIKDFERVLVIDGKAHGIVKMEHRKSTENGKEYIRFYTTLQNLNSRIHEEFDLSKEEATTFLQNYGYKTIYIGIRYGGCDKLLNGFTI